MSVGSSLYGGTPRHLLKCRADTTAFRPCSCCTAPTRSGQSQRCFQLQSSSSPPSPAISAKAHSDEGAACAELRAAGLRLTGRAGQCKAGCTGTSWALRTGFGQRRGIQEHSSSQQQLHACWHSPRCVGALSLSAGDAVPVAAGQQLRGCQQGNRGSSTPLHSLSVLLGWHPGSQCPVLLVAQCHLHKAALPGIPGVI